MRQQSCQTSVFQKPKKLLKKIRRDFLPACLQSSQTNLLTP